MRLNKKAIVGILIALGIIITLVYVSLFFGWEKGAENSWLIGVGLFGGLCGGGATFMAVILSLEESRKIQRENIEKEKLQIKMRNYKEAYIKLHGSIIKLNKIKDTNIDMETYRSLVEVKLEFICIQKNDGVILINSILQLSGELSAEEKHNKILMEKAKNLVENYDKVDEAILNSNKKILELQSNFDMKKLEFAKELKVLQDEIDKMHSGNYK